MTKERDSFGASPDFREHQMEFFCFLPKWAGLRLQFRDGADDHPQEVCRFTRFLFARSATKSKFLFCHCIVSLAIIRANAGPTANKLFDQRPRHWRPRNNVRKIDYRFAETRRALVQVVSSLRSWLNGLSNCMTLAAFIPKSVF